MYLAAVLKCQNLYKPAGDCSMECAHLLLECCWRLPWPALPTLCWLHLVQCAQAGMSDRHLACTAQVLSQRLSDDLGPTEARRLHRNMRQWLLNHLKLWRLACASTTPAPSSDAQAARRTDSKSVLMATQSLHCTRWAQQDWQLLWAAQGSLSSTFKFRISGSEAAWLTSRTTIQCFPSDF